MIHSFDESEAMPDDRRLRSTSSASTLSEEKAPHGHQQQQPRGGRGIMQKLGSLLHYPRRKSGRYGGDAQEENRMDAGVKRWQTRMKKEAEETATKQAKKNRSMDHVDSPWMVRNSAEEDGDEAKQQDEEGKVGKGMAQNEDQQTARAARRSWSERESSGNGAGIHGRKKSLSRVWQQVGGRVFCGSAAHNGLPNGRTPIDLHSHGDGDSPGNDSRADYLRPQTFFGIAVSEDEVSDEAYWLALADSILKHRQRSGSSPMADDIEGEVDQDRQVLQSKLIGSTQPEEEERAEPWSCPSQKQAEIEAVLQQEEEQGGNEEEIEEDEECKKLQLMINGGSTRMNTMLEESPCLLQSHQQRAGGGSSSSSRVAAATPEPEEEEQQQQQPLQSFLLQEREGGRTSLMVLLHEEEQEEGSAAAAAEAAAMVAEEAAEEAELPQAAAAAAEDPLLCCVCMVRRKGAALIPCGHTFCRSCAGHLFAQRGACPLCNHLIAQTLHIF